MINLTKNTLEKDFRVILWILSFEVIQNQPLTTDNFISNTLNIFEKWFFTQKKFLTQKATNKIKSATKTLNALNVHIKLQQL